VNARGCGNFQIWGDRRESEGKGKEKKREKKEANDQRE
jgi:hypothetical protein